jgi:glycosyltransferase involved in cell wall biosynthesis
VNVEEHDEGASTSVAVVVCTYHRNDLLERFLAAVERCADAAGPDVRVGVVIVDDSADAAAEVVAKAWASAFALGVDYRNTASRNIAIARNAALEGGTAMADWVAMTDDDCAPEPAWIVELLACARRTGADGVSGGRRYVVPAGSPRWLHEQGFLAEPEQDGDGERIPWGITANLLLSSAWLSAHPGVRFDVEYGRVGGEDMRFFADAAAAGLDLRRAVGAVVEELLHGDRSRLRGQLRMIFWFGNSEYVVNAAHGLGRTRLLARAGRRAARSVAAVPARVRDGRGVQGRRLLADLVHAAGLASGAVGLKLAHH